MVVQASSLGRCIFPTQDCILPGGVRARLHTVRVGGDTQFSLYQKLRDGNLLSPEAQSLLASHNSGFQISEKPASVKVVSVLRRDFGNALPKIPYLNQVEELVFALGGTWCPHEVSARWMLGSTGCAHERTIFLTHGILDSDERSHTLGIIYDKDGRPNKLFAPDISRVPLGPDQNKRQLIVFGHTDAMQIGS